jgi:hypothetical protein
MPTPFVTADIMALISDKMDYFEKHIPSIDPYASERVAE